MPVAKHPAFPAIKRQIGEEHRAEYEAAGWKVSRPAPAKKSAAKKTTAKK